MTDHIHLHLSNAAATGAFGASLAKVIYTRPLDILWEGPVGSGKSTAIRGLFGALGVREHVTSPTFALEQHYLASDATPLLHLDLYRMDAMEARAFLTQTDEHEGVRCIEWAERGAGSPAPLPRITVVMAEDGTGRSADVTCTDIPLPDDTQIDAWRDEVCLPEQVRSHCDAVARMACACADSVLGRGIAVRREALRKAARLHDLLRFIDFAQPIWGEQTPATRDCWHTWKERFAGQRHEDACATFLAQSGYDALGTIVRTHGLRLPSPERRTIEQQLLYYSDKRVAFDTVVTLDERFADFARRYGKTHADAEGSIWMKEAQGVEQELFPDGRPPV